MWIISKLMVLVLFYPIGRFGHRRYLTARLNIFDYKGKKGQNLAFKMCLARRGSNEI